jgi:hypothetical protein
MKFIKPYRLYESINNIKFIKGIHVRSYSSNYLDYLDNKTEELTDTNYHTIKDILTDFYSKDWRIEGYASFKSKYTYIISIGKKDEEKYHFHLYKYEDDYYEVIISYSSMVIHLLIDQLEPLRLLFMLIDNGRIYDFVRNWRGLTSGSIDIDLFFNQCEKFNEAFDGISFENGIYIVNDERDLYGKMNPASIFTENNINTVKDIMNKSGLLYKLNHIQDSSRDMISIFFGTEKSGDSFNSDGFLIISKMEDDYYMVQLTTFTDKSIMIIDQLEPLETIIKNL